jgi:hypothetical protein
MVYCDSPTTNAASSPVADARSMIAEWSGVKVCQLDSVAAESSAVGKSSHCHTVAEGAGAGVI